VFWQVNFIFYGKEKVRNFIIKYQDRLLYGTDLVTGWGEKGIAGDIEQLDKTYLSDYRYFAADEEIEVPLISESAHVRGLALPANVLKKIFYENARKWFPGICTFFIPTSLSGRITCPSKTSPELCNLPNK